MAVRAGTAELPIAPILQKTFSRDLLNQMAGPATRAATQTGRDTGQRFGRQFGRQLERSGDDSARRFGLRFNKRLGSGFSASTKIASLAAGSIAGAFAAVQVAGFLKDAIDEAREAQKVGRQTAAVIKATGGVAKVSARDVDRLTEALSNKAGVDDELIATGANLLLTFKGVRNEAGAGNRIFDQASAAILDMTAAMNEGNVTSQGLKASTIQVGKALNDPIKGMTALTRVGVTFTQGQKDQVKSLVESGRTMDAQKIILRELSSEFGGAAAAAADPWQRVGVVMGNVKEDIGTLLLPAISSASTFIADKLVPATRNFAEEHGPAFGRAFRSARDAIGEMIAKARAWWETHGPAVKAAFDDAKVAVFGVRGELDKIKKSWDDNAAAITGVSGSVKELTGPTGIPTLTQLVRGIGEEIRGTIELLGWFARAWTALGNASSAAAKVQVAAVAFFADAFRGLINVILTGNRKIIAGAATVAEALHLPMAGALRRAEQNFGKMQRSANADLDRIMGGVSDTQAAINRLKGKNVNITGTTSLQFTKSFTRTDWLAARVAAGRMATGGKVPGGYGGGDKVPILAEPGEAVVDKKRTRKYADVLGQMGVPGFQGGGLIGGIRGTGEAHTGVGKIMDFAGTRVMAALIKALASGGGSAAIKAFIRSTDPLPYVWGGAGPGGFDCSGIVSAVLGKMLNMGGAGSGLRLFTTSTIRAGQYGLQSGLGGTLQIGVTPGRGHMAGRYGGLGFEAESTATGIKTGAAASRPESFARHYYHMARGGRVDRDQLAAYATQTGLDVGGDPGKLRINGQTFDRGGALSPGLNLLANRTGRPEPLVPANQTGPVDLSPPSRRALARDIADALVAAGVGQVYLDGRRVDRQLQTASLLNSRR